MEKNKSLAKAIEKVSDNLEYIIVACEFDETGELSYDSNLFRLYAIRDLLALFERNVKKLGAI